VTICKNCLHLTQVYPAVVLVKVKPGPLLLYSIWIYDLKRPDIFRSKHAVPANLTPELRDDETQNYTSSKSLHKGCVPWEPVTARRHTLSVLEQAVKYPLCFEDSGCANRLKYSDFNEASFLHFFSVLPAEFWTIHSFTRLRFHRHNSTTPHQSK
jgi:hypothetical protein